MLVRTIYLLYFWSFIKAQDFVRFWRPLFISANPTGIYLFKAKNKTPEQCYWRRSAVILLTLTLLLHIPLAFLLLTLNKKMSPGNYKICVLSFFFHCSIAQKFGNYSDPICNNKWRSMTQQVTTSHNEWQRMTTSGRFD